jgi:predicted transcriptional regulator
MRKSFVILITVVLLFGNAAFSDPISSDSFADQFIVSQSGPDFSRAHQGPWPPPMMGPNQMRDNTGVRRPLDPERMLMKSFFLIPPVVEALGLTNEQIAKLEKLRDDNAKKIIDMQADISKNSIDLTSLMKGPNLNISAIQVLMQKIADKKVQMQIAKLKAFEQAKSVLTAEQKAKLDKMRKDGRPQGPPPMKKNMKSAFETPDEFDFF